MLTSENGVIYEKRRTLNLTVPSKNFYEICTFKTSKNMFIIRKHVKSIFVSIKDAVNMFEKHFQKQMFTNVA